MKVRRFLCFAFFLAAGAGSVMAQQSGAAGSGSALSGGTGGMASVGNGSTSGSSGNSSTNGSTDNFDDAGIGAALDAATSMDTSKIFDLRNGAIGRAGIHNNIASGLDGTAPSNSNGGPIGAGVRYRTNATQKAPARFAMTLSGGQTSGGAGSGMGASAARGIGTSGLQNAFGQGGTFGSLGGSQSSARPKIRLNLGLAAPNAAASNNINRPSNLVSSRVQTHPQFARVPGLEVLENGRTVTLRGTVKSQEEKDRLGRALKVMGGVGEVRNEIVVSEQRSPSDR